MLSRFVVSQVKHNSYFLVGLVLGLWVALVAVPLDEGPEPCALAVAGGEARADPPADDYEPVREQKPLGNGGAAPSGGRSLQRPRYYSTELGMRAPLLAGVLTSEDALSMCYLLTRSSYDHSLYPQNWFPFAVSILELNYLYDNTFTISS